MIVINLKKSELPQQSFRLISINKMYGLRQDAIDRIQQRLKQKIYREMLEQQQKYKRTLEDEKRRDRYEPHIRTQPSQHIQGYPARRNNAKGFPNLNYESNFLPVIHQARPTKDYDENDSRYEQHQPYRSTDSINLSKKGSRKRYTNDTYAEDDTLDFRNTREQEAEGSDEQKAQLYIEQCEQIIGSLKELTNKNGRKLKPKVNKYDPNQPMLGNSRKNTRKPSYKRINNNQSFRNNASTPLYRDYGSKTPVAEYGRSELQPINDFLSKYFNKNDDRQPPVDVNNFENSRPGKKKPKKHKVRANHINISPPKGEEEDENPEDDEEDEDEDEDDEEIPPPKAKKTPNEPKKKDKQTEKQIEKEKGKNQRGKSKAGNNGQQADNGENDRQKEQKQQKAIVKYLKKARVRGNLLSQKIEQRKKQPKEDNEAQAQADDPQADSPP